jgi:hypothetical protein
MTLRSAILLSAAVIGLSLPNLPDAKADLCFRYGTGGFLVAKGATLPAQNTCESLALFEPDQSGGRGGAANGLPGRH